MKILYALIICSLNTWYTRGQNKFATCDRTWRKIGCYNDRVKPTRTLPEMLLNDRETNSPHHQPGYLLNWHKWRQSLHSLACRCAEEARLKGYRVFGLQFYGECWSGPSALNDYNRDRDSKNCIMNLYKPTECKKEDAEECVGLKNTNYIYQLNENPGPQSPDIDGNYTSWSEWTICSKTCGGGYKSRERTCTNPKPKGNGQPCDPRLGEPEETVKCNEQVCYECDKMMDVGFVIDSSSSVKRSNFLKIKQFLVDLVGQIHISYRMTHVSVIRYNQRPQVMWKFNDNEAHNRLALTDALLNLDYKPGGTRTDIALKKAYEEISSSARPSVPHVVLVVTDGKTHSSSEKYSYVLKPFKVKNVPIIAIGVGSSVDMQELTQIAMYKSENVIKVSEFGKLVSRIHDILKTFCAARTGKDGNKAK